MLSLKNVDSYYGESRVIENLSFEVEKGGIVGLIGRNGVGKSTTLKSIMGIVKTPKGEIIFDGENIIKKPVYERVKLGIGYVPQGRDIFSRMTVEENILAILETTALSEEERLAKMNSLIEEFHIDKKRSWFIGDSSKDVKCAEDAGVKPLRIHKNQDITPVIDQILKSKDSF